jgi:hypothetical protein
VCSDKAELDELLSQRDKINLRLQEIIDRQTDPRGIKVTAVGQRCYFARQHETRDGRPGGVGAGAPRKNHKRRRRVSGSAKARAGGIDDSRATDRPATALFTDDEGNFERA